MVEVANLDELRRARGYYAPDVGLTGALDVIELRAKRKPRRRWRRLFTREIPMKRLQRDFVVRVRGRLIIVPAGFETNYASTPWFVWWICPPDGLWTPAAVVHDFLYASGIVTRAEADLIFLGLMRRLGVPKFQRRMMYRALRAFGWLAWNECRKQELKRVTQHGHK